MSVIVEFTYLTGVRTALFRNVRLTGSWDDSGRFSDLRSNHPMEEIVAEDGCPAFRATVALDGNSGDSFQWGVIADGPGGRNLWAIPNEVNDVGSRERTRTLVLGEGPTQQARYWLTHGRRLGANKRYRAGGSPEIEFAVWAPNARAVEVVFGDVDSGYISDTGEGATSARGQFPMTRDDDGVWWTKIADSPELGNFSAHDHAPYMFLVTKDDGSMAYRTDMYSRCQIGRGTFDPARPPPGMTFSGSRQDLDGTVSCSVVVDPDRVTKLFAEGVWPETRWLDDDDFWRNELDPLRPLPAHVGDLVIYELHVGGLAFGRIDPDGTPIPGRLSDAIELLPHLVDLGVNAVELLPMAEFEGWASWGYGSSHFFAVEFSGGGRDQLKHFVRACHRRGIAVIMDVVYNHYIADAERAEWMYDSNDHTRNIYYTYEGRPEDYPGATPPGEGGYVDNMSTGYAPRFGDEMVRKMFTSSAVALALEFHVDGFRVDQTTSIHLYPVIHADGAVAESARIYGAKFLREWTRTLRLVKPSTMMMAEDHSNWRAVTESSETGGLGFDASWYADFYHHLSGDTQHAGAANLLTTAARSTDAPLAMELFAGALRESANQRVVYHESHDEAGNAPNTGRTVTIAVGRAPLIGETRRYAEARSRFAVALAMLSAGTPMFFMGEEVGASEDYRHDDFVYHRPDLLGGRTGEGARLFHFYQDLITLRRTVAALRSRVLDVVHVHDANRVLGFLRSDGQDQVLVLASLNDRPFPSGYVVGDPAIPDANWQEVFNSDAGEYGGDGVGNRGSVLRSSNATLQAVLPANGVVVFRRRWL